MADEATSGTTTTESGTTESGTTQTAGTQAGGGGSGAGTGPLPELEPGSANTQWVTFLQQMLNYYYQMQVCAEDGHYGGQTTRVVEHFRAEKKLPPGDSVDTAVWGKLGLQDSAAHSGGQQGGSAQSADFEDYDCQVAPQNASSNETCWATAMAIVLKNHGDDISADDLCRQAGDSMNLDRARQVGADRSMSPVSCQAGVTSSLAATLHAHGPLWTPVSDYYVIVLAGIRHNDGSPQVRVLDPLAGSDTWLAMADLASDYGIGESFSGEVLAAS